MSGYVKIIDCDDQESLQPMTLSTECSNDMYLVAGLGNPGLEYRRTRHNIGFIAVEALAKEIGFSFKRMKFKAMIAEGHFEDKPLVLAKPLTYMNESGSAVSSLLRYFKIPCEHLLIIHDDLDLPLGTIRLRAAGGTSGQKGMTSIIEKLGTQNFPRMRLGIGRPPGQMEPADYVLQRFSKSEEELLKIVVTNAVEAAQSFLRDGLTSAMNRYNGEAG